MENERELNFSEIEEDDELISGRMYNFRDPVVERVVDQFVERSNTGYKKYGQTLDSERPTGVKNLGDYLQDVQEELMDAILYIQAAKEELRDKPQCNCKVKDVDNKTTLSDSESLKELREKIHRLEYYGSEYVSDNT